MSFFFVDSDNLMVDLSELEKRFDAATRMLMQESGNKLSLSAKRNRKWTDRTADARTRLHASTRKTKTGYRIALHHGVDYGIWLEIANEKRFAIIEPTIRLNSQEIFNAFANLMEKAYITNITFTGGNNYDDITERYLGGEEDL